LFRAIENPFQLKIPDTEKRNVNCYKPEQGKTNQLVSRLHDPKQSDSKLWNQDRQKKNVSTPALENKSKKTKTLGDSPESSPEELRAYEQFIDLELCRREVALDEMRQNYVKKLSCLRSVLDPKRFEEAVIGCVRNDLMKQYALPTFNEWKEAELKKQKSF